MFDICLQVKTIQDAIKEKKTVFEFQGETIKIVWSVGLFITMNPGYAGRTELPENLKALFRLLQVISMRVCMNEIITTFHHNVIFFIFC